MFGNHDTDPSKLLPGWQINEKIMKLEKEIAELDKQTGGKMAQKRKLDETESSRRFRNKEAKQSHIPPWLRQQRVVNHVDSDCTLLERQNAGHVHGYTVSSSVLHGPVAGSMHENVAGSLAGTVAMGRDGAGISASGNGIRAGISEGMDIVQQGASYAGGHGGTLVDSTPEQIGSHTGQLYGWRGNAAVYDGLASCSYAYRLSSYLEGSTGLPNTQPSDAYRSPPYLEGSMGLPNTIHSDAHRPPPYLEGSAGLPNTIHSDAHRSPPYLEGSAGLPNTIHSDAHRPPPYLEGSAGLPNTIHSDAHRSPPYLEGSAGLPNTIHSDAHRSPPYLEGSAGLPNTIHSDAHRPPPYLEGSAGLPNATHSDAYRPPPYLEGSAGLPNAIHSDAYRPPPYLEGFAGLPNAIPSDVAGRSYASENQVADTVTASELCRSRGPRAVDVVSSAVSAHPLSYLYWPR